MQIVSLVVLETVTFLLSQERGVQSLSCAQEVIMANLSQPSQQIVNTFPIIYAGNVASVADQKVMHILVA